MQRVRMSLPYFNEFNWETTIVCVKTKFTEVNQDPLLLKTVPDSTKLIQVDAWSTKWTRKFGLGAIAIRSMPYYKKEVNRLLKKEKFDLIYFSTTQFPILALGNYWNKKFKIPYVIDLQDPWICDYYTNKASHEKPKKYWISKIVSRILEPIAMRRCKGIIAVSEAYISETLKRHQHLKDIPTKQITFGAYPDDLKIAQQNIESYPSAIQKRKGEIAIGYIGRGGYDMHDALKILFEAFKAGLKTKEAFFSRIRFYFLGTSYAQANLGEPTILPLALEMGLGENVIEDTNRIPFYQTLNTLMDFDALFICGSNDPRYTASKIYPYISTQKPLLAIFHRQSSASHIIKECNAGTVIHFDTPVLEQFENINSFLTNIYSQKTEINHLAFENYTAREMTKQQCLLFEEAIKNDQSNN